MRGVVINLLEVLCWILFFLNIAAGVFLGANIGDMFPMMESGQALEAPNPIISMILGGVAGLISSIVIFGALFTLLDIRANSRKTARLLEDLKERRMAAQRAGD